MSQKAKTAINLGRIVVRAAIGVLVALLLILVGIWWRLRPIPNRNALAIGPDAAVSGPVSIPIAAPAEFDWLTRDAVFALRREAVLQHSDLLAADYTPADAVFGDIVDERPWWGMAGQFYYGSGEMSIEGPSEESRFVLNPYLLVHPEFFGFSFYYTGRLEWDEARISQADLANPDFPWVCHPQGLTWWPQEARAEVTYQVRDCLAAMNQYTVTTLTIAEDGWFDLAAYNARDLNLNYIYVDYAASQNVRKEGERPQGAVALPFLLHQGGSCGYPGGCNNMSPAFAALEELKLEGLPARVVVRLWGAEPPSLEQPADFVFTIHME